MVSPSAIPTTLPDQAQAGQGSTRDKNSARRRTEENHLDIDLSSTQGFAISIFLICEICVLIFFGFCKKSASFTDPVLRVFADSCRSFEPGKVWRVELMNTT